MGIISIIMSILRDEPNLADFPAKLAEALNIELFSAQLLASGIVICTFLFPTLLLTRDNANQAFAASIVGLAMMGFCIALGWLPVWIMLICSMLIALFLADRVIPRARPEE